MKTAPNAVSDTAYVPTDAETTLAAAQSVSCTVVGFFGSVPPECAPAGPAAPVAAAAPPVQVDAATLAQQAVDTMQIPTPQIGIGPDFDKVAVNLWTWLWIDEPDPVSLTVSAGPVSVTATATLAQTEWSMGEPTENPDSAASAVAPPLVCDGAGVAPVEGEFDWQEQPPCGYKYRWRSSPERTGGAGTWPLTVTARWNVTWTATTGESGADTLTASSTTAVRVGEYRIVLVPPGGG